MFFCNGKIILFTEINNSKRGYPTFWTAPSVLLYNRITLPHRLLRSSTGATTNSESCDFVLSSLLFSFDATNIEMIFFKFQIIMDFYSNGYILFVLILFRIGIDVLPFSLIPGKILASLFLFSRFLLLS